MTANQPRLLSNCDAIFSPCRQYRYVLWRVWDESKPYLNFIGLNPSTADEQVDDATIRRVVGFAKRFGYGGVYVTNLFAYCATLPTVMKAAIDPIGAENDRWLCEIAEKAGCVLVAWGVDGDFKGRADTVMSMLNRQAYCLGVTKAGYPRHPLRLSNSTELIKYGKGTT